MDREQLISKLNFFYSFELNQVDLYTTQSKNIPDDYTALAFKRIAYIEQQHVDNIAVQIRELGAKPTLLGDVISPIIGKMLGKSLTLLGTNNVLRANILLEKIAMRDYKRLIHSIRHKYSQSLIFTLQSNLIDEDLHAAWFLNKIKQNKRME